MHYKPGSVIGDYVVIGAIGAGGMGTVYKVQHVITQRIEAMKLLVSGRTEPDQEQRFVREMQVQARLHHPNIASVYNAFRFYDEFFLVMEFIEGESLESMLERGRLPLATGINYACQALLALSYAHAHGVVHRDIAPSNVLIMPDGTVKLTDFGLAKTATDIRLTRSGAPVGSPWYMSPEQVRGDAALEARSDIYSLGVVLYEIATGKKPFDLASTFDVMRAHVEMAPLTPLDRAPDLPPRLNEIILTAMAKDPNQRFQSAEQFYAALAPLETDGAPGLMPAPLSPHAGAVREGTPIPRTQPLLPRNSPWHWLPQVARVRMVQTALGTAACGLALFGGYATYSLLRANSANLPAIAPAKTGIPPAPEAPTARQSALPVITEVAAPPPVKRARVNRRPRPLRRFTARVPSSEQRLADFPPAPEAPALPRIAALPPAPSIARTPAPAAPPKIVASDDIAAPEPPAETPAPKKNGNRLLRALQKVVPFHRQTPSNLSDESATSAVSKGR